MKKVLSLMLCVLMFTGALAQTESEHLTFKGVPIDGSLKSFVEKMKRKGFVYQSTLNDAAIMKGTFSGYSDCSIYIVSTEANDSVYMVGVSFPEDNSWSSLSSTYFRLKEMLITKYGEPSECTETFDTYSQPSDDQMKFLYTKTDRCKYETVFLITAKGMIKLIISHIKVNYVDSCYVSLTYTDLKNYMSNRSEAIDDL